MSITVEPLSITQVNWDALLRKIDRSRVALLPKDWGKADPLALPQLLNILAEGGDWTLEFIDAGFLVTAPTDLSLDIARSGLSWGKVQSDPFLFILKGNLKDWRDITICLLSPESRVPASIQTIFNMIYLYFEKVGYWGLFSAYNKRKVDKTFVLERKR